MHSQQECSGRMSFRKSFALHSRHSRLFCRTQEPKKLLPTYLCWHQTGSPEFSAWFFVVRDTPHHLLAPMWTTLLLFPTPPPKCDFRVSELSCLSLRASNRKSQIAAVSIWSRKFDSQGWPAVPLTACRWMLNSDRATWIHDPSFWVREGFAISSLSTELSVRNRFRFEFGSQLV